MHSEIRLSECIYLGQKPYQQRQVMRQKRNKPLVNVQFKTFNSEQSCIDVYSKVQSIFFQKFFKYNLTDYFYDTFFNTEEDLTANFHNNKSTKQLAAETFIIKSQFNVSAFQRKINQFYSCRSKCAENSQISFSFKHLYSNIEGDCHIEQNDLVFIKVKIKAQIAKVQSLPLLLYKELSQCESQNTNINESEDVVAKLKAYQKQSINLFVVYYGDINFNLFNKENYQKTKITLFGREVNVKIHVFYVSRIAMIETFKSINKIENLEYVNDLLIQLYEFKRQKIKKKRRKALQAKHIYQAKKTKRQVLLKIFKWFTFLSIVGLSLGALILKFIL